jgi:hypothetical protein
MPYILAKVGDKWVVKKKDTGEIVAGNKTKLTEEAAKAVMRARYAAEAGTLDSQKKKK